MENIITEGRTRRDFLKGAGAVVAGGVVVGVIGSQLSCEGIPGVVQPAAAAEAYLVHDSEKCQNCVSCMMACSLAHEGIASLSLSRRQVIADFSGHYPHDLEHMDCRQCTWVPCIDTCPSGAFHVDTDNGNTRTIDEAMCKNYQDSIAPDTCRLCVDNCPYVPSMAIWNHRKGNAIVCDLCNNTPFWSETGGVDGKQACVEVCPMKTIKLVKGETPSQFDNEGYNVNLKSPNYIGMNTNNQSRQWWVEPAPITQRIGSPIF